MAGVLIGLALLAFWLFSLFDVVTATVGLEQHGGSTAVGLLLLAIAAVKIRLVALHFMEVKDAPMPLRLLVEAYVVLTFVAMVVLYLVV